MNSERVLPREEARIVLDACVQRSLNGGQDEIVFAGVNQAGPVIWTEPCRPKLTFRVISPQLLMLWGSDDDRYLCNFFHASAVDFVSLSKESSIVNNGSFYLQLEFSRITAVVNTLDYLDSRDMSLFALPSGLRLGQLVDITSRDRVNHVVRDALESNQFGLDPGLLTGITLKVIAIDVDPDDNLDKMRTINVCQGNYTLGANQSLQAVNHLFLSGKRDETGAGDESCIKPYEEAEMIRSFGRFLVEADADVILCEHRQTITELLDFLGVSFRLDRCPKRDDLDQVGSVSRVFGRWIVDLRMVEELVNIRPSHLLNTVVRGNSDAAVLLRSLWTWRYLDDLVRLVVSRKSTLSLLLQERPAAAHKERHDVEDRRFAPTQEYSKKMRISTHLGHWGLNEEESKNIATFDHWESQFCLQSIPERLDDLLIEMAIRFKQKDFESGEQCVRMLLEMASRNRSLRDRLVLFKDDAPSLLVRVKRLINKMLIKDVSAKEFITFIRLPATAAANAAGPMVELKNHFFQFVCSSSSNQKAGPWDRLLGSEASERLFEDCISQMSVAEILAIVTSASTLAATREEAHAQLRLCVLIKILESSPDAIAFADSRVKSCAGSCFELLVKGKDEARARTLFEALSVTTGDFEAPSSADDPDVFTLTTPWRHRERVESWRRLGERTWEGSESETSGEDAIPKIEVVSLWIKGIRGEVALNTIACLVGTISRRKRPLPVTAMAISTQPDEENMIPVAFVASLVRSIEKLIRSQASPLAMNESIAFAFGCRRLSLPSSSSVIQFSSETVNALPEDVVSMCKAMLMSTAALPKVNAASLEGINAYAALFLKLSLLLFSDDDLRKTTGALRMILDRCAIQILSGIVSTSAQDLVSCEWVKHILGYKLPSDTSASFPLTSSDAVLREERLALAHLRNAVRRSDGGCVQCCGVATFTIEAFWKVHVVCSSSEQTLMSMAQVLESSGTLSGLRAQFEAPGVSARVQVLTKSICDRLEHMLTRLVNHLGDNSEEAKSFIVRKINAMLRVLGALSFAHPIGRTAIIDHLCWDIILQSISSLSAAAKWSSIRTNCFVLLHEIITNASMTQGETKQQSSSSSSSFFVSKRDDFLLVDLDRRLRLVERLLKNSLNGEDPNTVSIGLESACRIVEMYRNKQNCDEQKRSLAQATLDYFIVLVRDIRVMQLLGTDDRIRSTFAKFVGTVVSICPLLHRITAHSTVQSAAMIGVTVERQSLVKQASIHLARFVDRAVGEKMVASLQSS